MKKIIIFNASSFIYGAERGLLNLINALKNDFNITVVVPCKGPLVKKIREVCPSVNIIIFPLSVLMFSLSPLYFAKFIFLFFVNFFFFLFYINYNDIDIISTNSLLLTFPVLCARLLNRFHIWHIREIFPYKFMNYILGNYAKLFSSQIVCQSEFIKEKLHLNKAAVIYEPLNKKDYKFYGYSRARDKLNIPHNAVVISIISRIHPAKGQYEFISELRKLLQRDKNVIVLIAGDISISTFHNRAYKRKIEELVKKYSLSNVRILGFVDDIGLVLSAIDICTFPFKREEPFGIAAAEALACRIDAFYPPAGGLSEVRRIFRRGNDFNIDEIIKRVRNYRRYANTRRKTTFNIPDELSLKRYKNVIIKTYKNVP